MRSIMIDSSKLIHLIIILNVDNINFEFVSWIINFRCGKYHEYHNKPKSSYQKHYEIRFINNNELVRPK